MAPEHHRPVLSVVIPTYNRADLLERTLDSMARQSLPEPYEVVVVDDGSTDETPTVLRAWATRDPRFRPVRTSVNRGRSAARNEGVRAARGDVVVFVDSDVLVGPDFLARHLEVHQKAGTPVLCRGPVAVIPDFKLPERTPIAMSPAYLDTANASLPRSEIVQAGGFDEGFRAYGWEDFDLGLRLQHRGLPRIFVRDAVAYHFQPLPSVENFADHLQKEEERARTAVYFHAKHPGWRTRFLIQHTFAHRLVYFLMMGGGLLNERNAPRLAGRLRARGLPQLGYLVLRAVLNSHYVRALAQEWQRGAGAPH